jgi:hypothetical protein
MTEEIIREIGDYACRPSPEVYPETIEHWAAWLTVGMILILQAETLKGAKEIANIRLREATDVIYGIQAFPQDVMSDWRKHVRR